MSDIEVKKSFMDYTNLAANVHQSIKLGEISNQLNQLTSINTAMLGNMNNLVNIEVYKLEQEDNEKQFKQLLFNLKKFVKTKYEDPLTIMLLKNGHCNVMNALLENFQRELKSFDDKEYVENIMDRFEEYSNQDIDLDALSKDTEAVSTLLSYLMFTDSVSAKEKALDSHKDKLEKMRAEVYTPMKHWTTETLNDWFEKIDLRTDDGTSFRVDEKKYPMKNNVHLLRIKDFLKGSEEFQIIFTKLSNGTICIGNIHDINKKSMIHLRYGLLGQHNFKKKLEKIENEILPSLIGDSEDKTDKLSTEYESSFEELSKSLNNIDSEWINVEKKLLNIMYDTTLPIQGPYQYRKQVIGE